MGNTVSKYVYGVVPASAPAPRGAGIGDARVQTIVAADTAAIVSDVPEGELQAGRTELMVHARVLEEALESGAVLPMRFGVVMENADSVRRDLLERFHDELVPQLDELEGKVELHVRAVYEEQALMSEVVRTNPEIARLREELRGQPEDATYYERIRLGEMVAAAVERQRERESTEIVDALAPLALAIEAGSPQHERVVLTASFLVERSRLEEFDRAVDELGRRQAGRMRFKYTGPLPAHSFVQLSLQD
jgi:gas vesicle protein GvpL/GvpF